MSAQRIYLIATEESGDRLGAALMQAVRLRLGDDVTFEGIGGAAMAAQGLTSLFPIHDLSIIGFAAVVKQMPMLLKRIRAAADDVIAAEPDMLVIIDSPDFTHRVAKRVRAANPKIKIVDYVSPTVWAWRPGRAHAMRAYVDHVLALLPFEPEAHRRLGGPACTYVGHPLIEQIASLRPDAAEQARRDARPPLLLVLPGSRRSEIRHHMAVFGDALTVLRDRGVAFAPVLPTMPHLVEAVTEAIKTWPVQPRLVLGEDDKRAAFRVAHAALAKSGTVTLELAIAGVPMVTAYRGGSIEIWIAKRLIQLSSVILANLVIGKNVVPQYIQQDCTAPRLAAALAEVIGDTSLRRQQLAAFATLDAIMATGATTPSAKAAEVIVGLLG